MANSIPNFSKIDTFLKINKFLNDNLQNPDIPKVQFWDFVKSIDQFKDFTSAMLVNDGIVAEVQDENDLINMRFEIHIEIFSDELINEDLLKYALLNKYTLFSNSGIGSYMLTVYPVELLADEKVGDFYLKDYFNDKWSWMISPAGLEDETYLATVKLISKYIKNDDFELFKAYVLSEMDGYKPEHDGFCKSINEILNNRN